VICLSWCTLPNAPCNSLRSGAADRPPDRSSRTLHSLTGSPRHGHVKPAADHCQSCGVIGIWSSSGWMLHLEYLTDPNLQSILTCFAYLTSSDFAMPIWESLISISYASHCHPCETPLAHFVLHIHGDRGIRPQSEISEYPEPGRPVRGGLPLTASLHGAPSRRDQAFLACWCYHLGRRGSSGASGSRFGSPDRSDWPAWRDGLAAGEACGKRNPLQNHGFNPSQPPAGLRGPQRVEHWNLSAGINLFPWALSTSNKSCC
jgi:hypothetical protein